MSHDPPNPAPPPSPRRGSGRIRREVGSHWFFVELTLEVAPAERRVLIIDLDEPAGGADAAYAGTIDAAIKFAEEKALFRLKRPELAALHVVLRRLAVSSIGTTAPLVFYATLLALEEALEIEIPDVKLDWNTLELRLKLANGKRPRRP